jgi:PIN domain nuclease of toxin-antitoxin system
VKLLLDTHALLWMFAAPAQLGRRASRAVADTRNVLFLSTASLWEIGIKVGIRKLDLGRRWAQQLERRMTEAGISLLPIALRHCERLSRLPHHHGDPFDRLIAAQSLSEKLIIISRDAQFDAYGAKRLW